jgi:hypothetical protein
MGNTKIQGGQVTIEGKSRSVGICSIATNEYISLWDDMATSADQIFTRESNVVFHVFTDQVEFCIKRIREFQNIQCKVHRIENLIWPAATIDRYRVFFEAKNALTEDFLVHMDADMIIHKDFLLELEKFPLKQQITCVAHPGYWRKKIFSRGEYSLQRRVKDLFLFLKVGALGAWETRPESAAFVPRSSRKDYVCGGVWMGNRLAFLDLCETLYASVEYDHSRNVIAKWHDESHLNHWISTHDFNLLPPSFCFSKDYPHLSELENIIEAVTKDEKFLDSKGSS